MLYNIKSNKGYIPYNKLKVKKYCGGKIMNTAKNIETSTHTEDPTSLTNKSNPKQLYLELKTELQDAIESLKYATTREMADKELRRIKAIIMSVNVGNRFEAIKSYTKDLEEKVYAVMRYDVTRSDLCNILNELLERIDSVINNEKGKKQKEFFWDMPENTGDIMEVMDI